MSDEEFNEPLAKRKFQEIARHQLVEGIHRIINMIQGSLPGEEFKWTGSELARVDMLARELGYACGPIQYHRSRDGNVSIQAHSPWETVSQAWVSHPGAKTPPWRDEVLMILRQWLEKMQSHRWLERQVPANVLHEKINRRPSPGDSQAAPSKGASSKSAGPRISSRFDSGHDQSEGDWCDPVALDRIARAINQTTTKTKEILTKTGLKQLTRERWICRYDCLQATWADRIQTECTST